MKITKLLLLVLSCMLIVGCKKNKSDDPTPPAPQTDTISTQVVQSYFPYKNMDKIVFFNDLTGNVTYTVVSSKTTYEQNKMLLAVTMTGGDYAGHGNYFISLKAGVTDGTLFTIDFQQITGGAFEVNGTYTYDATKGKEIPESITLSNGAIIEKDQGLIYYEDADSEKWYFKKRK